MWLRIGIHYDALYTKDVAEGANIDIIIRLYSATSKAFYPVETIRMYMGIGTMSSASRWKPRDLYI